MSNHKDPYIEDALELRRLEEGLKEQITKICRAYSVKKLKRNLALQKLSDCVQILIGNHDSERIRKFTEKDELNLSLAIKELGHGRQYLFLAKKEDGSGVVEILTGKEYLFK